MKEQRVGRTVDCLRLMANGWTDVPLRTTTARDGCGKGRHLDELLDDGDVDGDIKKDLV